MFVYTFANLTQLNFSLTVDMEGSGPSALSSRCVEDLLPVNCDNCYLNYRDFCLFYSGNFERLLIYAQDHGLVKKECKCPTCGSLCTQVSFIGLSYVNS